MARERERGEKRPVLLVCPTTVLGNWQREAAKFTPGLAVLCHHGPDRGLGDLFAEEAKNYALVVTSYALLPRDYATLRRVSWAGVILDEAQNIKNPDTRQSQAARALTADYRFALTGTPVENHVGDLWSIMDFLNPGLLGARTAFRERFLRPIQAGVDPAARERLRRATAPFILRRLKTDRTVISDLPEKTENKVFCPLTREQAAMYASVLADLSNALVGAEGIKRRGLVLATLTRLKQICNHPENYAKAGGELANRSGKLDRIGAMLEEVVSSGDHALVFTQFAEMGTLLQQHIGQLFGFEPPFLHGGVPAHERDRMVAAFQAAGGPPVFVLSLRAGGTGLNLTRANHVFHFDRWWNPAVENQATDRAFRIGQTRDVMVHKLICSGTLEDRIDAMITAKTAVADDVIGSGEAWLTKLSDEELKATLALVPGAVADDEDEPPVRKPAHAVPTRRMREDWT
jgi:SNF2 family DNA or RNA helicase